MNPSTINNRANIKAAENQKFQGFNLKKNSGIENDFSNAPKVGNQFIVRCFQNAIVFAPAFINTTPAEPPVREENDIKEFSAKSRKRLFDIFAKLDYESYGIPVFISATYHYDRPGNRAEIKNMISNYFRYLKHKLPPFHYITKLEYQQRGMPHFHFILLPLDNNINFAEEKFLKLFHSKWLSLKDCKCDHCQKYSIKTVQVKDYKHAVIYISKEIAKVQDRYEEHDLGRIWSTSQNLRFKKYFEFEADLNFYDELLKLMIKNVKEKTRSEIYLKSLRWSYNPATLYVNINDIKPLVLKYLNERKKKEEKTIFENLRKLHLKKRY